MELNKRQEAVVTAPIDRPAKVVAGAGTGKTRVLVERYLRFLRDGIAPSRLLALTFTLKAADEMRQRIFEAVEKDHPELLRELYSAWIMNFHSFGFRIIRENAPAFGIDPGVDVASEAELRRIDRVMESRFMSGRIGGVPDDFGGSIPPPSGLGSVFKVFLGVVNKCRGDMIPIESLFASIRDDDTAPYKAAVASIGAVYDEFLGEMDRRNLIDFDDMIGLAARGLAGNAALAAAYGAKFDHILVDEFQDTSAAQFALLRVLSDDRYSKVTVVGDEKQSIYRWRDARVENIRDFPGDDLPLSTNYRSRQNILDLAHAFVTRDADLATRAVALEADRALPGKPIVLFHPGDEYDGQQNDLEAAALAAWIVQVTGDEPVGYGDVAVLLRAVREYKVVPAIERAFMRAGIPYVILGGADAAGTRALESLHAYLSLLLPGDRRVELLHVLESRPFDVGHAVLAELFGRDGTEPGDRHTLLSDDRLERITDDAERARLSQLRTLLDSLDAARASMDFRRFLSGAVEDTPFLLRLFAEDATPRSVEDLLGELSDMCGTLEAKRELGLWSFLDHLRAAIDGRSFGRVEPLAVPPARVRIMTVHQAKGLEFPAVAVAGIRPPKNDSSGFFLSKTDGIFSDTRKEWNRPYKKTAERDVEKELGRQEERCLLYVAMTRAEDFLYVSSPYSGGGKSLFADVLEAAQELDPPAVVWRSAPSDVRAAGASELPEPPTPGELEGTISEWKSTRESLAEHLDSAAGPAAGVQFVNWTALKTFADCPLQYQYRYVLGVGDGFAGEAPDAQSLAQEKGDDISPVHIPGNVTPVDYGIFVHDLLRESLESRSAGAELPDGWIGNAVDRSGLQKKRSKEIVDRASKLIDAFHSSDLAMPGEGIRVEEPFQVRLDRAVLHGIFDRVERTGDGWVVTDYKIGQEKDVYAFQVAFYAWALGRITGEGSAAGRLCYLREDETVTRPVDVSGGEIETLVAAIDESLSGGEFRASPGDVCAACQFSTLCPHAAGQSA